jgi:hypothetical protein
MELPQDRLTAKIMEAAAATDQPAEADRPLTALRAEAKIPAAMVLI